MKKTLLLLVLISHAMGSFAQKNKKSVAAPLPPPRVWIQNTSSYTVPHQLLVDNPFMVTDSVGCKVSGFTVSLLAPGHPFYGPLYSNTWEMTTIQKGVIKTWGDYRNVTLYIQDIHLNCHETDATSPPLTYYFNMDEEKK